MPCILYLENRTSEKIAVMTLLEGLHERGTGVRATEHVYRDTTYT